MIAALVLALTTVAVPKDLAFMQGAWEGGTSTLKFEERRTEKAGA